jgi:PPM family protein phosphatase
VSLRYAVLSDVGSIRERNEDSARAVPERGLFVVCDGMGGHVGGDVASQLAVQRFVDAVLEKPEPNGNDEAAQLLLAAARVANTEVLRAAAERRLWGMGTTLTAALVRGRNVSIVHVGDSRAYFANQKLVQLTRDHTVVSMLVGSGILSEQEAHLHPERHVLVQAVGTQIQIEPDVVHARFPRSTSLLLCSDGLHDVVPAETMLACMQSSDLQKAAAALISAANACGGPDNITVALIAP